MEAGRVESLFRNPRHAYTCALHRAVPEFDMKPGERLQPVREIDHQTGPMMAARAPWPVSEHGSVHLRATAISKSFTLRRSGWLRAHPDEQIHAVTDVSFEILQGECFGLVGESGCGKTTLSKILMRALRPDRGQLEYNDRGRPVDLLALRNEALEAFRPRMQFIFQDPFSSLNPRMTVLDILREPLVIHRVGNSTEQTEMAKELMRLVGLDPRFLNRYPHSFSGGQRQRIGIARALALRPDFLICDEPVSALDVSVQAQILNLMKDLQAELGLTLLFISHNLAVVDYVADRIAVMCRGRLVEIAPRQLLFRDPRHPYTRALLGAVPFADLDHPLDFDAVARGNASEPARWPPPYRLENDAPSRFEDLGERHLVRVTAS